MIEIKEQTLAPICSAAGEEHVQHKSLVDGRARHFGERYQGASVRVPIPPIINSSRIPVLFDKFALFHITIGEVGVVGGRGDKGGAGSEKGDVEGPQVLEGAVDGE